MSFLYFLLTVFIIGLLVAVHEGGHFVAARLCGITVNEFSVGMGPKILSKVSKKSSIRYSLRLLPIGGYVSMAGENEDSDDENAFNNKSVPKRMITAFAGVLMNFVLGFVCMFILVAGTKNLASTVVCDFSGDATSAQCGLAEGDRILKIGSTSVHTGNELAYEIMNRGHVPVNVTIERNGERLTLYDVSFPTTEEQGVVFGDMDFRVYAEEKTFFAVAKHTFWRSCSTVKMVVDSLKDLIRGRYGLDSVSGPIGMTETVGNAAKSGWLSLIYLVSFISVNLGVMNLLPIPGLDGGRLLFLLLEAVRRKPVKREIEAYINFAGLALLMILMFVIMAKDIIALF